MQALAATGDVQHRQLLGSWPFENKSEQARDVVNMNKLKLILKVLLSERENDGKSLAPATKSLGELALAGGSSAKGADQVIVHGCSREDVRTQDESVAIAELAR